MELRAGLRRDAERVELFLPAAPGRAGVEVRARAAPVQHRVRARGSALRSGAAFESAVLELRIDERGLADAELLFAEGHIPVDELLLSGPLMELRRRSGEPARATFEPAGGERARLGSLGCALIGCSRLGSVVASGLVRAGAIDLALVDGDLLEEHCIDAVECDAQDLGKPKVIAVARHLRRAHPGLGLRPIAAPVESVEAFEACSRSEIVLSAPDDNRARLTAALAATAHLRPHLDLGTGVFAGGEIEGRAGEPWTAGADLRLVLPGDGCLLCAGGLDLDRRRAGDWRRQRAGSLRSLNRMAAGVGLGLLEGMLAGRIRRSRWVRLLLAADGGVELREMRWRVAPDCPLCSRRSGIGSAALRGFGPGVAAGAIGPRTA